MMGKMERTKMMRKRKIETPLLNRSWPYFFRRDGALRIKVTVSSDTVYHCHLLMQTKDKHFGGNSLSFQINSIH